jgi:hypothetical protein
MFWNHIYDQTVEIRAITEIINRYSKEPFWTRKQYEIRSTSRNRHDLGRDCVAQFLTSVRFLSREMDEPALRFIGSLAMILLFSDPPADGELQEKFV